MSKTTAKRIVKNLTGKTVSGRCQVNYHGCGEYSLAWDPDPNEPKFRQYQHFQA